MSAKSAFSEKTGMADNGTGYLGGAMMAGMLR